MVAARRGDVEDPPRFGCSPSHPSMAQTNVDVVGKLPQRNARTPPEHLPSHSRAPPERCPSAARARRPRRETLAILVYEFRAYSRAREASCRPNLSLERPCPGVFWSADMVWRAQETTPRAGTQDSPFEEITVQSVLTTYDANGDGRIDLQEFMDVVREAIDRLAGTKWDSNRNSRSEPLFSSHLYGLSSVGGLGPNSTSGCRDFLLVGNFVVAPRQLYGDHPTNLEGYTYYQHGACAVMTCQHRDGNTMPFSRLGTVPAKLLTSEHSQC